MIKNDKELQVTLKRVERLQKQTAVIRKTAKDDTNYKASVIGFIAEIDRMQLEVREYLLTAPEQLIEVA